MNVPMVIIDRGRVMIMTTGQWEARSSLQSVLTRTDES